MSGRISRTMFKIFNCLFVSAICYPLQVRSSVSRLAFVRPKSICMIIKDYSYQQNKQKTHETKQRNSPAQDLHFLEILLNYNNSQLRFGAITFFIQTFVVNRRSSSIKTIPLRRAIQNHGSDCPSGVRSVGIRS